MSFHLSRLFLVFGLFLASAHASESPFTIQDYNASLPYWGTSWLSGSGPNGYYPSFYTGFAPRTSDPSRIHMRLSRGNQTRLSVVLDDDTLRDYLFDLVKRYQFFKKVTSGSHPMVNVRPDEGRTVHVLPHLTYFNQVIESEAYGILPFVAAAGSKTPEEIHEKSLQVLSALNPHRVFPIRLNLTREFLNWKVQMRTMLTGVADLNTYFTAKSPSTVVALNSLVPGRVNVNVAPSADILAQLVSVAQMALTDGSEEDFVSAMVQLFKNVTGNRYAFRTLESGRFTSPIQCASAAHCFLMYPEFTTIYPTGSIKETTTDKFGNSITNFATPGLWNFVSRGERNVDNIRGEPYYGWAPKMDYQAIGNGFHNPAVRFWNMNRTLKTALGVPLHHNTYWSVKRGGVSHGCSRLSSGHIWEMRGIFPNVDSKMTQVQFFGSTARDFDLFDVNGDGSPEVMGVEYFISYGLQEADGLGSREGTDLEIGKEHKFAFYQTLYGPREVFRQTASGSFEFLSPTIAMPSYLDKLRPSVATHLTFNGVYPLYEQAYERDKIQLYLPITTEGLTSPGAGHLSKRIVRLMGRIRGCAPTANKEECGEAAFDREANAILVEAGYGAGL